MEAPISLSRDSVKSILDDFAKRNDAFCSAFFLAIIFHGNCIPERNILGGNVEAFLSSLGNRRTKSINSNELDRELLPGAYVLQNGRFWKVARLYDDTAEVFSVGLQVLPDRRYAPLVPRNLQAVCTRMQYCTPPLSRQKAKSPRIIAVYRLTSALIVRCRRSHAYSPLTD